MGEEIAFENGQISAFQGLITLTLDRVILHTVMHHSSTSTYIPNVIEIEETFCGRTDERTYGEAEGRRLTRRSRPNYIAHIAMKQATLKWWKQSLINDKCQKQRLLLTPFGRGLSCTSSRRCSLCTWWQSTSEVRTIVLCKHTPGDTFYCRLLTFERISFVCRTSYLTTYNNKCITYGKTSTSVGTNINTCQFYVHTLRDILQTCLNFTNGTSLAWRLCWHISTVMFTSRRAWPAPLPIRLRLGFLGEQRSQKFYSLPWTLMNRRAKCDASSFIIGGEIRNHTNTHT